MECEMTIQNVGKHPQGRCRCENIVYLLVFAER